MGNPDTIASITEALGDENLAILGGFHPQPGDAVPDGIGTLLLVGPREPGFWAHVSAAPEFGDGGVDPLDRWSRRVIGRVACGAGAKAYFPFTGPPWHPFIRWALRTGWAWTSPVTLLVHAEAGLLVSFRGALGLRDRLPLPAPPVEAPCTRCDGQPCRTACPAGALTSAGYDVARCHAFLDTDSGAGCMAAGCRVRAACPVSRRYGRHPDQSGYHMRQFHR